jgi:hypothetical protein
MAVSCCVSCFLIGPTDVYSAQQPVFFTTWSFLIDTVQRPGGLATYLGLLLSQGCFYEETGAAIFALLMGAVYAGTLAFLRLITGALRPISALVPCALLFPMHCSYFHFLEFDVKTIFLCACGIISFPVWRAASVSRAVSFTTLLLAVYAAAGAAVSMAFLVMFFSLLPCINAPRKGLGALLAGGVAAALIIGIACGSSVVQNPFTEAAAEMICAHYALTFLPLTVLLTFAFLPLGSFFARKYDIGLRLLQGRQGALCGLSAIVLLSSAGAFFCYDPVIARCLRFDRYAREGKWKSILTEAKSLPAPNTFDRYFLYRSLCHEDMLGDEAVANPVLAGENAMLINVAENHCLFSEIFNSDLFFEMGATNQAVRWAFEAINDVLCLSPRLLQRLTLCYAAQGKIEMARSLLAILGTTLVGRHWARDFTPLLDDSLCLATNSDIQRLRMLGPVKTYVSGDLSSYEFRHIWLHSRTFNKMAFEYSLALVPSLLNDEMTFTSLMTKCRAGDDSSCLKMRADFANTRLLYDYSDGNK